MHTSKKDFGIPTCESVERSRSLRHWLALLLVVLIFLTTGFLSTGFLPAGAQNGIAQVDEMQPPIDMMIVIDNSCSMFPREQILAGCTTWGSDPDFLRIKGADVFLARLGFSQANAGDYQVGVIDFGDAPRLISPLKPLEGARDALAQAIANPRPKTATLLVPALKLAYQELRESPNRRPENLPAIVLITDGVPWPSEGQSNADIEALVKENPDIPLFILLLRNAREHSLAYEQFIQFWQQLQVQYSYVFVHSIGSAAEIEQHYYEISAQLNNTVASEAMLASPEITLHAFVSRYVQKITVTAIHSIGEVRGNITITDPLGGIVSDDDAGVTHFRGEDNPVEVISIAAPRLMNNLKDKIWTIQSDQPVNVFLDREGAYNIKFLDPNPDSTAVNNVFVDPSPENPKRDFVIRFYLAGEDKAPVLEPQPIQGQVIYPDGTQNGLVIPPDLLPDSGGNYELHFDFGRAYPGILNSNGRFIFFLDAGSADNQSSRPVPIASSRLLVDVSAIPYIEKIQPGEITCRPGIKSVLNVTLGDIQNLQSGSAKVRAVIESKESVLQDLSGGIFGGDVTPICDALIRTAACSKQVELTITLLFTASLKDGTELRQTQVKVPIRGVASECTATPPPTTPTAFVIPTLAPTPIPDSDQDRFNDLVDVCPTTRGWEVFQGCPPPVWFDITGAGLAGALLLFLWFYIFPWLSVHIGERPPQAYIMVRERGNPAFPPFDVYAIGMKRRKKRLKIGGDRQKADIYIRGLKPVEFSLDMEGEKVLLVDAKHGALKGTFRHLAPDEVQTSNPEIRLILGLDRGVLKRMK